MEQIGSGLLSRSRWSCRGQTPRQHLLRELWLRRVVFDAASRAGAGAAPWVWAAGLPASKAEIFPWKRWAAPQ